jgi:hypothetical protein
MFARRVGLVKNLIEFNPVLLLLGLGCEIREQGSQRGETKLLLLCARCSVVEREILSGG